MRDRTGCRFRPESVNTDVMQSGRLVVQWAGLGLAAGIGWWTWRHGHSATVAAWSAGSGAQRRTGQLSVRTVGSGEPVILLLHGMIAAGNSFGAAYDELADVATLVVPDLLGFGASMQTSRPIDAEAHIRALDDALRVLGLDRRPTVVVGHSMGGSLALRWAARHTDRVRLVVTFGAPLYLNRGEADQHVAAMGRMEASLAGDGIPSRVLCAWMCRHRTLASWIAVAYRPDLPVPVARSGVKHTWATYTGSMGGLIRDDGWREALDRLAKARIPVHLAAGVRDPVPVVGRAEELACSHPNITVAVHPYADHGLPLTDPEWCRRLIAGAMEAVCGGVVRTRRGGHPR